MALADRIRRFWNAFRFDEAQQPVRDFGTAHSSRPDRQRLIIYNERSLISSIYNRLSVDVAEIPFRHVRVDKEGRYTEEVNSALNDCLWYQSNLDQAPRAFVQDIALTVFDKGVAAIVPVDTADSPNVTEYFDIYTMRVGEVVTWYPKHVRLRVYNEATGQREEITLEKRFVAIVENPFYAVMNEPNSTLQRLLRKLSLLDTVDGQAASGKLDIIIQLPYVIKSESRRQQAEQRRKDIEFQLTGSQYGIAYTDGTEKITQLNRPAENNLFAQVEYLTKLLYEQLGLTEAVMNGTADEAAMKYYYNRTIEPVVQAIAEAMQRSFLGSAKVRKAERIMYFRDPFKLVPLQNMADIADKMTRNEILTTNEIRQFMGIAPSQDPKADVLMNPNMPQPNPGLKELPPATPALMPSNSERIRQNGS
jgi:Phage portal protein